MSTSCAATIASPHRENSPSTVEGMGTQVTLAELAALRCSPGLRPRPAPRGPGCGRLSSGEELARAAGATPTERATTWWTSALRFLGCTGHAFDMAVVFGDEIEMRADTGARPISPTRSTSCASMIGHAGPGPVGCRPAPLGALGLGRGKTAAEMNFRTACEVADVFAKRLGLDEPVLLRWRPRSSAGTAGPTTGAKGSRSRGLCGSLN